MQPALSVCVSACVFVYMCVCEYGTPALSHEQLESIRPSRRHGQMKAITADAPDHRRRVDVFVRNFMSQHFPQHNAKRPAVTTPITTALRFLPIYLQLNGHLQGENGSDDSLRFLHPFLLEETLLGISDIRLLMGWMLFCQPANVAQCSKHSGTMCSRA